MDKVFYLGATNSQDTVRLDSLDSKLTEQEQKDIEVMTLMRWSRRAGLLGNVRALPPAMATA